MPSCSNRLHLQLLLVALTCQVALAKPRCSHALSAAPPAVTHLSHCSSRAALAGKNVTYTVTNDGIAIVKLDLQGSKVNTLNLSLNEEMGPLLDKLVHLRDASF